MSASANRLVFTVTNDLSYDQRMIRICTSLCKAGYQVTLVGRKLNNSLPLIKQPFVQRRLYCFASKGPLFYIEFNVRLFFYLLVKKCDLVCAIDLDTILPCLYVSKLREKVRVHDAHELFCEMKEIVSRPQIHKIWKWIEQHSFPQFPYGYTVNESIAQEYKKLYGHSYGVIRNAPVLNVLPPKTITGGYILYQGAVNEGRGFEYLIPAMQQVNAQLIICGDGNYMKQAQLLVKQYELQHKIIFKGILSPNDLKAVTQQAYIGINLIERESRSCYLSLANKYFDYIHAGIPQITMDYPEYSRINKAYPVAVLLSDLTTVSIASAINNLLQDEVMYKMLAHNTALAAADYNWQNEEVKLLAFYSKLLNKPTS